MKCAHSAHLTIENAVLSSSMSTNLKPVIVACSWKASASLNSLDSGNSGLGSSRKYPYLPHGRLTEIPRGMRVSKAQFIKGKYGTKMGFPKGVGVQAKKPSMRGVWIFSGTTHSAKAFLKTQTSWYVYQGYSSHLLLPSVH